MHSTEIMYTDRWRRPDQALGLEDQNALAGQPQRRLGTAAMSGFDTKRGAFTWLVHKADHSLRGHGQASFFSQDPFEVRPNLLPISRDQAS